MRATAPLSRGARDPRGGAGGDGRLGGPGGLGNRRELRKLWNLRELGGGHGMNVRTAGETGVGGR